MKKYLIFVSLMAAAAGFGMFGLTETSIVFRAVLGGASVSIAMLAGIVLASD